MDQQKTKKRAGKPTGNSNLEEKMPELETGVDWSQFYTLEEKERIPTPLFLTEQVIYSFVLRNSADLPPYISWGEMMKKIFQSALNSTLKGVKPNDLVLVNVEFIHTPLRTCLPMQRRDQVTGPRLFEKIQMIDYDDFITWGSSMKLTVTIMYVS
jgi:hypothetical protein